MLLCPARRMAGICDHRGMDRDIVCERLEPRRLLSGWFVAPGGADSSPGTLAAPFATIQHAANVAQPGDTVFVRGGTYRETITPARAGASGAPIVFEPYNGEQVTISGADPVSGWSVSQGAIYQASQPWDLGNGNNQVFVDGALIGEAQWPNGGSLFHPAFATATTITSSTPATGPFGGTATATITSAALTDPPDTWNGATIHIAPGEGWVWQTGTVLSSQPGQLTYQYTQLNTSFQIPRDGNSFYLTGKFHGLDAPSEWFRDPATGSLYLWTPQSDSPSAHDVQVKRRLYAFELSGLSFITVRGFNLFADSIDTSASSNNLVLSNLNAQYVSSATVDPNPFADKNSPPTTGILLNGPNITLLDSTIGFSAGNGVVLAGADDVVQNCFIHDVDYSGGDGAGITLFGDGDQALHNTIWNTGRNGITQYFATVTQLQNNVIHDFGLMTSDAGGIYAWNVNGQGSVVAFNLVSNSHAGGFGNTGIFMDTGANNFVIHHNVVWNVDSALKLNPPAHVEQVYNNTLVGTQFSLGSGDPPDMAGSVVENNIMMGHLVWGQGVTQQHNFTTGDPGFADAASGNFQLAAGSPAIDAGMPIPPYTDGFTGAAPDQGAYERGAAAFAAGATAVPTPVFTPGSQPPAGQSAPPRAAVGPVIPIASFDSASAVQMDSDGSVSAAPGDWMRFTGVDFATGVKLLEMNLAVPGPLRGVKIVLRLDSAAGPILATLRPSRGRFGAALHTQTARAKRITGVHDVYILILGRSGTIQLDSFTFTPLPVRASHHHARRR